MSIASLSRRVTEMFPHAVVTVIRDSPPLIYRFDSSTIDAAFVDVVDEGFWHIFDSGRLEAEFQYEEEEDVLDLIGRVGRGELASWRSILSPWVVRAAFVDGEFTLLGGRTLWKKLANFGTW